MIQGMKGARVKEWIDTVTQHIVSTGMAIELKYADGECHGDIGGWDAITLDCGKISNRAEVMISLQFTTKARGLYQRALEVRTGREQESMAYKLGKVETAVNLLMAERELVTHEENKKAEKKKREIQERNEVKQRQEASMKVGKAMEKRQKMEREKREEMKKTTTEAETKAREWKQLRQDQIASTKGEVEGADMEMTNGMMTLTPAEIITLANKVQQGRKRLEMLREDKDASPNVDIGSGWSVVEGTTCREVEVTMRTIGDLTEEEKKNLPQAIISVAELTSSALKTTGRRGCISQKKSASRRTRSPCAPHVPRRD